MPSEAEDQTPLLTLKASIQKMARPEKIIDLDDVKTWITDHDARIDVYWENQHERNKNMDNLLTRLGDRMSSVEKKVMWFAGVASLLGAILGGLVASHLG